MYPFPLFLPLLASYKGKLLLFSFQCLIHSHNLIQEFSGISLSFPCSMCIEQNSGDKIFMKLVYKQLLLKLQEYLPDFKIANAVIHFDEASPHMHVVGVPVGRGFKRGLSTKVSKRSVFTPQVLSEILQDKMRADASYYMKAIFQQELRNFAVSGKRKRAKTMT